MPGSRYQIVQTPDLGRYAIYDKQLDALCALPDGTDGLNLIPLEWDLHEEAALWLYRCRTAWRDNTVPAPHRWNSWRPDPLSPWWNYTTPDPDDRIGPATRSAP